MAAPKKSKKSQVELAEMSGVSVKTLRSWAKLEGLDLNDEAAVMARAEETKLRFSAVEDAGEVKLRKLKAEADILEHKLAVQRGDYVSAMEVENEGLRIGTAVKSVFLRMPDDLPPLLAGRTAAEVKVAVGKYVRDKLTELSSYRSPVKIENAGGMAQELAAKDSELPTKQNG